ncbi:sulfite exporter TauE/SafE family protein [Candidatus Woesearchaeota archaeon]|jgi:uncharacterized membrane protein YfcA|nr:sulfite exporter TauE/SafE family protein [Candidatus Woesearchaeota archaeon]
MTLVIILALVIGLLLGLLGGGGSILTVPVLVYLLNIDPKTAFATSLLVVGTTSLIAMLGHARAGRVCVRTGLVFGLAGMLGAYGGGRLAAFIPGGILLLLFATLMFGTAFALLRNRRTEDSAAEKNAPLCPAHLPVMAILFDGLLVGGMTGLVGAGGGFLIVPALNLLGGLRMHAAVGTSLLVIVMNAIAGLAGYITHVHIDYRLAALLTGFAALGSLIGGVFSSRIQANVLRRVFGLFVIGIACYLLYREFKPELLDETQRLIAQHPDFLWGVATVILGFLLFRVREWIHTQSLLMIRD